MIYGLTGRSPTAVQPGTGLVEPGSMISGFDCRLDAGVKSYPIVSTRAAAGCPVEDVVAAGDVPGP